MTRSRHCCLTTILFFFTSNRSITTLASATHDVSPPSSSSSAFAWILPSKTSLAVPSSRCPPSASANANIPTTVSELFCSHGNDRNNNVDDTTRRRFVASSLLHSISVATFVGSPISPPLFFANAATTTTTSSSTSSSSQVQKDKENLVRGYNRLQYLLDNWEEETTECKIGQETTFGDKCERTPTKVMDYLGFKSTNDPLFKADTTMMRLKDVIPPYNSNREAEYYDAIDSFVQNSEEANSMAFVSSWGEANPGGGKDRVRLFIERSRKNVIASRDGLLTVLDILDLKP